MIADIDDCATLIITDGGKNCLRYWHLPTSQRPFQEGVDIMPREPYTTGLAVLELLCAKGNLAIGTLRYELFGEFRDCRGCGDLYDSYMRVFDTVVRGLVRDELVRVGG